MALLRRHQREALKRELTELIRSRRLSVYAHQGEAAYMLAEGLIKLASNTQPQVLKLEGNSVSFLSTYFSLHNRAARRIATEIVAIDLSKLIVDRKLQVSKNEDDTLPGKRGLMFLYTITGG